MNRLRQLILPSYLPFPLPKVSRRQSFLHRLQTTTRLRGLNSPARQGSTHFTPQRRIIPRHSYLPYPARIPLPPCLKTLTFPLLLISQTCMERHLVMDSRLIILGIPMAILLLMCLPNPLRAHLGQRQGQDTRPSNRYLQGRDTCTSNHYQVPLLAGVPN